MSLREPVILDPSLPHMREIEALVQLIHECYTKGDILAVVITETHNHGSWLLQKMADSVNWMGSTSGIKIYREGIEFQETHSKIIMSTYGMPDRLRGMHPDKILLFGTLGELFYLMNMSGAEIIPVA